MRTGVVSALITLIGLTVVGLRPATARTGSCAPIVRLDQPLGSPAGSLPAGPRANGTAVLPDGRILTPVGKEIGVELQPLNEVLSHDGRRLYVSSEGINDNPTTTSAGDGTHKRYLSVIDTASSQVVAKIRDDSLHYGIAESLDGTRLYISEGATDSIGIIDRVPGAPDTYRLEKRSIALDPTEKRRHVYPWGLTMSPDGSRLYAVGFASNMLYAVDLARGAPHVIAATPAGQYPFAVTMARDGKRLYVSNWGEYNAGVDEYNLKVDVSLPIVPPPVTIGGYNTPESSSVWAYNVNAGLPFLAQQAPIGHPLNGTTVDGGSQPSALALSPDGKTLAVTSSNDDLIELLDAANIHQARTVDLRIIPDGPTGAQPDALAWAPDGSTLFVAEAGRNTVAVVDPTTGAVLGRVPTAWYPDGLVVSPGGDRLWILNDNGLGSGPNTDLGPDGKPLPATYRSPSDPTHNGATDLAYIPNTLHGMVQAVDLPAACRALSTLSKASDLDNGLVQGVPAIDGTPQSGLAGSGYVVPTAYGKRPSDGVTKIKHVFLILKENRPFDQVFGDVAGNERDARFNDFGRAVTPNAHVLAQQFASSDNYYVNSETSRDGHYAVDTGQVTEFLQKTVPSSYAGKIPFDAMDTNPENLPLGGFIWDNASRAGVSTRIYGEGTYIVGVAPEVLGALGSGVPALNGRGLLIPGLAAANVTFDPLYPTQAALPGLSSTPLYQFNDVARANEFDRDFARQLGPARNLLTADPLVPQLNVLILFDDHTAGAIGNAPFPRDYVAENDGALGRVVNTIATSPVWKDSAIFVTEDDTQGGQDHVDAHRSFDVVISPWSKRPKTGPGYVSHVHTSFSSITKTIDLLLGVPPSSLQETVATSLADEFVSKGAPDTSIAPIQAERYGGSAFGFNDKRNYTVETAPNATLRLAAQIATLINPAIDQGGALAQYDLALEQQGLRELGDPSAQVGTDQEHTLATGSPATVVLAQKGGSCVAPPHRHSPAAVWIGPPLLGAAILVRGRRK